MKNKSRKQIIQENDVSQIYEFALGEIKQKVLVEGKNKNLPIAICLHGGRGGQ